jgi:hypothetical protein
MSRTLQALGGEVDINDDDAGWRTHGGKHEELLERYET